MRLTDRLARLEQRQHSEPIPCAFASVEAAQAAGCVGGWFLTGAPMDADEWAEAAKTQQAALCEVTHGKD